MTPPLLVCKIFIPYDGDMFKINDGTFLVNKRRRGGV